MLIDILYEPNQWKCAMTKCKKVTMPHVDCFIKKVKVWYTLVQKFTSIGVELSTKNINKDSYKTFTRVQVNMGFNLAKSL